MAVTKARQVRSLGATNDALTGEVVIQAIVVTGDDFELSTKVGNTEVTIFKPTTSRTITFPFGLALRGLKRKAGTGDCFIYLK